MTSQQIIATAIKNAVINNKVAIVGAISNGEAKLSDFAHHFLDGIKPTNPAAAFAYSLLKNPIEAEIDSLLNQYGPDEAYQWLLDEATAYAKGLGV